MDVPTKVCFKCPERGPQPLSAFYKHRQMADGHLNKCKVCTKRDVSRSYAEARPARAAYERKRAQNPERKAAQREHMAAHRARYPQRWAARVAVSNALRDGRLVRGACSVPGCTARAQAHHADYSKPLDVKWVCFKHHREQEHGQVVQ